MATWKMRYILTWGDDAQYTFAFSNSIFKTSITDLDTLGNMLNIDPEFINPVLYNYRLDTLSPAKDKGALLGVEFDLDQVLT